MTHEGAFLVMSTYEEVFGLRLTRENNFADECVGDPLRSPLVVLTYEEVLDGV